MILICLKAWPGDLEWNWIQNSQFLVLVLIHANIFLQLLARIYDC